MIQKTIPRGLRRFISREKARIRKTISDPTEQKRLIELLYPEAKNRVAIRTKKPVAV